jgi:hypothetical protein
MKVRCPQCGRFGKADLGGYCSPCKKTRRSTHVSRKLHKPNYGFNTGPFIPDKFGIMREEFEIVEKGE